MIKWNGKDFNSKITHHEAKLLTEIVMKRIAHIPKELGSDWRDLPNKDVTLPSGRRLQKLKYPYISWKTGQKAVCACLRKDRGKCGAMDRQEATLIPYSMCHTGDR